jgi:serine/threonine protein kinase
MKQVCLLCERTSPDHNLYCQEIYCPAEMAPNILDYGEWLGDIEIVKPIVVLRSSVLYEARHQKNKILLKVAHPGEQHTERLKREAGWLCEMQGKKARSPYMPVLLPPYANTTITDNPYGKAMLRGHLLYFCLFEHFEGEPLRDILTKNPQLWLYHIGWLMISLSYAVAFLQSKGMLHCGITPETVLVRFDEASNVPRVLLFDLGVVSTQRDVSALWDPAFVLPTYTAPELLTPGSPVANYATDVYGLGLTLYELLVGEPVFPFKLHSDDEVYQAVLRNQRVRMNRVEDVRLVADIATQAVQPQMSARQQNAAELADQLITYFGAVPGEKPRRWPSIRTTLILAGACLTVAFLITLIVTIDALYQLL